VGLGQRLWQTRKAIGGGAVPAFEITDERWQVNPSAHLPSPRAIFPGLQS
jgi:hypothetical protein